MLTKIGEASAQLEMLSVMNMVLMVVWWYEDKGEELFSTIEDLFLIVSTSYEVLPRRMSDDNEILTKFNTF